MNIAQGMAIQYSIMLALANVTRLDAFVRHSIFGLSFGYVSVEKMLTMPLGVSDPAYKTLK